MSHEFKDEKGLTLIETVAAIIIIGIIFLSFFNFFISSKKTGVASEEIIEATYIAQETMEEIYIITTNLPVDEIVNYYKSNKKNVQVSPSPYTQAFTITYTYPTNNILVQLQFSKQQSPNLHSNVNLYNVVVTVHENNVIKSSMENIISIQS